MANWKYYLRFEGFWHDKTISIEDKGSFVSVALLALQKQMYKTMSEDDFYCGDYFKLEELAEEFNCIEDVEEFDDYLCELYDFCDRYRVWVETI